MENDKQRFLVRLPILSLLVFTSLLWPRALSQTLKELTTYTYPPEGDFQTQFTPLRDKREISGSKRKAKLKPCSVEVQAELVRGLLKLLNDASFRTGEGDVDTSIRAMSVARTEAGSRRRCYTHLDPKTFWDELMALPKEEEKESASETRESPECTPPAPKSGYSPPEDSCLRSVRPYPNTDDVCQVIGENDLTVEYLDDDALLIGCPYHETGAIGDRLAEGVQQLDQIGSWVLLSVPERSRNAPSPRKPWANGMVSGGLCAASP